ncbi:hypothetical protein [Sphingobacterium bovistauri]|uniref:DUF4374 domain-containing protein n=1 Tax=Sphingobacterium bovistauri TaxID=2781959 RepID=A0ABS7ZD28_9SPHI|nr:hypothetical protein [Sphingobacterium bovistauri]MCA5006790.1 hypothetical protein [Sphingobacterium bovistauri]
MRNNLFKALVFGSAIAIGTLSSCEKSTDDDPNFLTGPDLGVRQFITLTGAFPDATGEAGNGGTRALAISLADAENPTFEANVFANGYTLRSQRTARVQASPNGNFLYNIQYTGDDGGIFNKYHVQGGKSFIDTREELNTEPILGSAPRWVIAANGIGVGVYASAQIQGSSTGAGADFVDVKSTAKILALDLDNPTILRQTEFIIPFTAEQTKAGYQIGRIDVPILNAAKNKVFIGCNLTKVDLTKKATVNDDGNQVWTTRESATNVRELGTATLVVDYPSLANPKLIYSTVSKTNNHSYRTMTQWLGSNGDIYQATATGGYQILKISSSTNTYDDSYNFDLKTALGSSSNIAIRAWRNIKEDIGLVLYTVTGTDGGYLALVDLKAKTATKLTTEQETNIGFSGRSANTATGVTAMVGTFGQFQNIGVYGDNLYVPLTPNGLDGNLYIINYKTKAIAKGAKLKNQSGSFYLGAY